MRDLGRSLGIGEDLNSPEARNNMIKYINLKLSALGLPIFKKGDTKVSKEAVSLGVQYSF